MSILNPYLSFRGNAREVMEFYKSVFGGDLTISTFDDFGAATTPEEGPQVMHSQLTTSHGLTIMASDAPARIDLTVGSNVSVSLSGTEEGELTGYWNGLSEGAEISQPLTKAPWGDSFGMLDDRFGIHWLVNITATPSA